MTLSSALGPVFWGLELGGAWLLPTNLLLPSPNSSQVTAARAKFRKTAAFGAAGGSLPEPHTHVSWAGESPGGCSTAAVHGIQASTPHLFSRGRNIPCLLEEEEEIGLCLVSVSFLTSNSPSQ